MGASPNVDLFDGLTALTTLNLSDNSLVSPHVDLFDGLTALQTLYLNDNSLAPLNVDLFDGLGDLGTLDLSDNSITALTAGVFEDLDDSLTNLYLRSNGLGALPAGIFAGLTGLAGLDLSCNSLTALDSMRLTPFASTLTFLDISGNSFTTPPTATDLTLTNSGLRFYSGVNTVCGPPDDIGLSGFTISPGTLTTPLVAPGDMGTFQATVAHDVSMTTVTITPRDPNAQIVPYGSNDIPLYDNDPNTPGWQLDLGAYRNSFQWQVQAKNGVFGVAQALQVYRSNPPASEARLHSLELSGVTLARTFDRGRLVYTGNAANDVTQTTVTAIPLDLDATTVIKRDGIVDSDGTVSLAVGANTITVEVTAEDGVTKRTYTVDVTRAYASPVFVEGPSTTRQFNETLGGATVTTASNIGTPVAATDTDAGDTLTYSLEGADAGKFTINRFTGQILTKVGENYDYEANQSYAVVVKVVDSHGSSDTISVTLDVRDLFEPPEVRFRSSSYTAIEGVGSAAVTVELSVAASQRVTIPVTELGQGGATAADWSGVPASVTFAIGETEQTFSVMAVSDSVDDDGESVRLGFGPLPSGVALGSPSTATVALVQDADVSTWYVWFGESAYTIREGGAGTRITLHLNAPWKPERNEALTVPLFTPQHQGGASSGDYSGVPENVTFYQGQTETSFTVRATDDSVDDDYESVLLPFRNLFPDDLEVGRYGPGSTTVHITDNDGEEPVTVSFEEANYTAEEGGAATMVRLRLDAAPGRTVTIPLTTTTSNRGATSGDYSGVPLSVTFGASETVKSFSLTATDDLANDDFESVVLGFGPLPSRVSAGSPSQAVVNLTDNDDGLAGVTVNFGAWAGAKRDGVEEGGSYFLNFRLDRTLGQKLTIPLTYECLDGATADDFSDLPASVTFAKGNRSAGVVLPVV